LSARCSTNALKGVLAITCWNAGKLRGPCLLTGAPRSRKRRMEDGRSQWRSRLLARSRVNAQCGVLVVLSIVCEGVGLVSWTLSVLNACSWIWKRRNRGSSSGRSKSRCSILLRQGWFRRGRLMCLFARNRFLKGFVVLRRKFGIVKHLLRRGLI